MAKKKGKGRKKGTPDFGCTEKQLQRYYLKTFKKPFIIALAALLRNRPKHAAVFLNKWLDPETLRQITMPKPMKEKDEKEKDEKGDKDKDNDKEKEKVLPGLEKPPLAKKIEEQEIVADTEGVADMRRYLDTYLRPLLIQALKAGVKSRCDPPELLPGLGSFMDSANAAMRTVEATEETLNEIKEVEANKHAAGKLMGRKGGIPVPTPLMVLEAQIDDVVRSMKGAVDAAKATFKKLGGTSRPPTKAADPSAPVPDKPPEAEKKESGKKGEKPKTPDKASDQGLTEVDALLECMQLTAETILSALQTADEAVQKCVEGVRANSGGVPALDQAETLGQLGRTRKQVEAEMEALRHTVITHADEHMAGFADFRLQDYLENMRAAILARITEIQEDAVRNIDDLFRDIESGYEKDRATLKQILRRARVRSGDTKQIQDMLRTTYKRVETQMNAYEAKLLEKVKDKDTRVTLPLFACISQAHAFCFYIYAHLSRCKCKKGELNRVFTEATGSTRRLQEQLVHLAKGIEKDAAEEEGPVDQDDPSAFAGIATEVKMATVTAELGRVVTDFEVAIMTGITLEEQRWVAFQQNMPVTPVNVKEIYLTNRPLVEAKIRELLEFVQQAMATGGATKMAVLSNMLNLRGILYLYQKTMESVIQSRHGVVAEGSGNTAAMKELLKAAPQVRLLLETLILNLGRHVPDWHEMYVNEMEWEMANSKILKKEKQGKKSKRK